MNEMAASTSQTMEEETLVSELDERFNPLITMLVENITQVMLAS